MQPKESHYDVVIIGAGMAGLAAGIRLAHFGRKICILERHNVVGGLNSFYSLNGRKFDVGLHAMTNFVPEGRKGTPLVKLLRQLRIHREELDLCEQFESKIMFPGVELAFTNEFSRLESEVSHCFPSQIDGFRLLVECVRSYDELSLAGEAISAREIVSRHIRDPVLADMIFCPLMFYGSAKEKDMDFYQFVIMFKALFMEGFARPFDGVRKVTRLLLAKLRELGAERCMKCGVEKLQTKGGKVTSIVLDGGHAITAGQVLSSIGARETEALFADTGFARAEPKKNATGRLSFVETITVLESQPSELGWGETIIFFNDSEHFDYSVPTQLVDPRSGVICLPNNFNYGERRLPEGLLRVTCLASYEQWKALPEEEYRKAKHEWFACMGRKALSFLPPVPREEWERQTVFTDMFTPRTIEKYTGHRNGAVYGAPDKIKNGRTEFENLYLCGTDQGFLGIIGAMLSGVSMANLHILSK